MDDEKAGNGHISCDGLPPPKWNQNLVTLVNPQQNLRIYQSKLDKGLAEVGAKWRETGGFAFFVNKHCILRPIVVFASSSQTSTIPLRSVSLQFPIMPAHR